MSCVAGVTWYLPGVVRGAHQTGEKKSDESGLLAGAERDLG